MGSSTLAWRHGYTIFIDESNITRKLIENYLIAATMAKKSTDDDDSNNGAISTQASSVYDRLQHDILTGHLSPD